MVESRRKGRNASPDMAFDKSADEIQSTLRPPSSNIESNARKSTLQKFSKDVLIKYMQITDYEEKDSHVAYLITVKGRTKYLVNL